MDTQNSAQDVVHCSLCNLSVAPMYCNICQLNLCKDCVVNHILDESKYHNVVPLKQRRSTTNYPKCPTHTSKQCELHCKQCNIPICIRCVSSAAHRGHEFVNLMKTHLKKKGFIRRDLQELEKSIFPLHKQFAYMLFLQTTDLSEHSRKLKKAIFEHRDYLHRQIDFVANSMELDLEEMNSKYLTVLNTQKVEIEFDISKIRRYIDYLKKQLDSNDISLVSTYKSRNAEFRKLPHNVKVILPQFIPDEINKDRIYQQFGSLSPLHFTTEERIYKKQTLTDELSPTDRQLRCEPLTVATIPTEIDDLTNVAYLGDEKIWTSGQGNIMMLYNLRGELVRSIQTTSGNWPEDITVTKNGDLVYTDYKDRTVNIVRNTLIQTVIRELEWGPLNVCGTSSGDLLVVMISNDEKQTIVVRYTGFKATQHIQHNKKGQALYSSGYGTKHISENNNHDICVSDNKACAVVVVNKDGKFKFRYIGSNFSTGVLKGNHTVSAACYRNTSIFTPVGITTDSHSRILTTDLSNNCIHILDQDGKFLCFINCDLFDPVGLCVDAKDCLLVAECRPCEVKKIKYCMQAKELYSICNV